MTVPVDLGGRVPESQRVRSRTSADGTAPGASSTRRIEGTLLRELELCRQKPLQGSKNPRRPQWGLRRCAVRANGCGRSTRPSRRCAHNLVLTDCTCAGLSLSWCSVGCEDGRLSVLVRLGDGPVAAALLVPAESIIICGALYATATHVTGALSVWCQEFCSPRCDEDYGSSPRDRTRSPRALTSTSIRILVGILNKASLSRTRVRGLSSSSVYFSSVQCSSVTEKNRFCSPFLFYLS